MPLTPDCEGLSKPDGNFSIVDIEQDGEITSVQIPCAAARFADHLNNHGGSAKVRQRRRGFPWLLLVCFQILGTVAFFSLGWVEVKRNRMTKEGKGYLRWTQIHWHHSPTGQDLEPHRWEQVIRGSVHAKGEMVDGVRKIEGPVIRRVD